MGAHSQYDRPRGGVIYLSDCATGGWEVVVVPSDTPEVQHLWFGDWNLLLFFAGGMAAVTGLPIEDKTTAHPLEVNQQRYKADEPLDRFFKVLRL